jgi:2-keto-4-pentenoate hydratase/2-oxohepta-3-ene-1,7-dioic acid hydratase in catechol pathway
MKLVVYSPKNRVGLLVQNRVVDLAGACALYLGIVKQEPRPDEMAAVLVGEDFRGFLAGGDRALETASTVNEYIMEEKREELDPITSVEGEKIILDANGIKFRSPIENLLSPKVMCAGANFADHHAGMQSRKLNKEISSEEALKTTKANPPRGFYKQASNIVGDDDAVPYPSRTNRLDYEGEIALVIGKRGKNITASNYLAYVLGYTLFFDFSIRDSELDKDRLNFALHKNFEASGSLGPCIATKDEIPDPSDLDIVTRVNGEIRQNGSTKSMVYSFGDLVELVSSDIILNPGDVITSGTPAGTAMDSSRENRANADSLFLRIGDSLELTSSRIGRLRNHIVASTVRKNL